MIAATITTRTSLTDGTTQFFDAVRFDLGALPALAGSDKQMAWAHTLRDTAIAAVNATMSRLIARDGTAIATDEALAKQSAGLAGAIGRINRALATATDVTWWIDNREALAANAMVALGKLAA